jgi:hypothetical protein
MPRPNFNSKLNVPSPSSSFPEPGPTARGPAPTGNIDMTWVEVWIFQNPQKGRAAAASGRSAPGASFGNNWSLRTKLAYDSDKFLKGKPAQATAVALLENPVDGTKEYYWWSESVTIG